MFYERTDSAIEFARKRVEAGRATKEDRLLLLLSDGEWHLGSEMTEEVSWRFGAYLFNLKESGVAWEKERVPVKGATVYKYRLSRVE